MTYQNSDCSGPYSSTKSSYLNCFYESTNVPAYVPFSANVYVSSQCMSGPTAPPTQAPTSPTPQPTTTNPMRIPTSEPTLFPIASPTPYPTAVQTGFVSAYSYDSSTCSGVPNTVTVYQLGICFYYCNSYYGCGHGMYSKATMAPSGYITLIYATYPSSQCTGSTLSSRSYNLAITCSGFNIYTYSTTAPVAPQSVSFRYAITVPIQLHSSVD